MTVPEICALAAGLAAAAEPEAGDGTALAEEALPPADNDGAAGEAAADDAGAVPAADVAGELAGAAEDGTGAAVSPQAARATARARLRGGNTVRRIIAWQ